MALRVDMLFVFGCLGVGGVGVFVNFIFGLVSFTIFFFFFFFFFFGTAAVLKCEYMYEFKRK